MHCWGNPEIDWLMFQRSGVTLSRMKFMKAAGEYQFLFGLFHCRFVFGGRDKKKHLEI